jgi:hypothetical protein
MIIVFTGNLNRAVNQRMLKLEEQKFGVQMTELGNRIAYKIQVTIGM